MYALVGLVGLVGFVIPGEKLSKAFTSHDIITMTRYSNVPIVRPFSCQPL